MKPRNKTAIVSFSLEHDLISWLDAYAAKTRRKRTQVIRELIAEQMKLPEGEYCAPSSNPRLVAEDRARRYTVARGGPKG